jgi:CheY-like chemotaxis protein/HPt (histidine-containing phosphotransfer) domain-containing protein
VGRFSDILDLSKVEAGKIELERRVFAPGQLLSETLGLYAGSARRKGLAFSAECALDDASAQFWGDPLRLRQILSNLVSNALKFTDSGSVKICVARGSDHAGQGGTGEMALRFTVSDTGIGIAADQREFLFKAFSQVDSSITRRFGGTGLGLAIIKHFVGLMGGKLGVDSMPGQGSRFWFELTLERADPVRLPALEDVNQALSAISAVKFSAPLPSLLPPTQRRALAHLWHILVVEDTLINRDLLEILLGKQGYHVSAVSNGQLAVDWVRQHRAPDLILMDCQMPVMDGLQATRLIRAWEQQTARPQPLPIIALTANAFEADRIRCLAAGMTDFLSKPFHFNDLNTLLARLLPAADAASVAKTCPPAPAVAPPDGADYAPCAAQDANPINLALALDRMEGDRGTFLCFATALPAQITDDQAEIQQAGAAGDAALLRKASHRLKSVLGTLGAERAHSACQALEIAARQQNSAAYPLLIHELEAALAALNPALADFLAHPAEYFSGAPGGGIGAY